mmetsp:Transcript_58774/g.80179  ORF Transcript_58774/g.80179 Transcript_58774/m.80179 type:complete len:308 (+) Transcript_58774:329-1252(+)
MKAGIKKGLRYMSDLRDSVGLVLPGGWWYSAGLSLLRGMKGQGAVGGGCCHFAFVAHHKNFLPLAFLCKHAKVKAPPHTVPKVDGDVGIVNDVRLDLYSVTFVPLVDVIHTYITGSENFDGIWVKFEVFVAPGDDPEHEIPKMTAFFNECASRCSTEPVPVPHFNEEGKAVLAYVHHDWPTDLTRVHVFQEPRDWWHKPILHSHPEDEPRTRGHMLLHETFGLQAILNGGAHGLFRKNMLSGGDNIPEEINVRVVRCRDNKYINGVHDNHVAVVNNEGNTSPGEKVLSFLSGPLISVGDGRDYHSID